MKKLIILFALLLALPCYGQDLARMNVGIVGASGAAAAGTWYYSPSGTSEGTYDFACYGNNNQYMGSTVVCGETGTITKISFKSTDKAVVDSPNQKLTITHPDAQTIHETHEYLYAAIVDNWNDFTLATPLACTQNQVVMLAFISSTTLQENCVTGGTTGFYKALGSDQYAAFPEDPLAGYTGSDYTRALRIYIVP